MSNTVAFKHIVLMWGAHQWFNELQQPYGLVEIGLHVSFMNMYIPKLMHASIVHKNTYSDAIESSHT